MSVISPLLSLITAIQNERVSIRLSHFNNYQVRIKTRLYILYANRHNEVWRHEKSFDITLFYWDGKTETVTALDKHIYKKLLILIESWQTK